MRRIEPKMNWYRFIAQCNVFFSQYSKFSDSVSKNIQDLKLLKANRKVSWQQKSFPWKHFWKFAWVTQLKQNLNCNKQEKKLCIIIIYKQFFSSWSWYEYKIRRKISKKVLFCRSIQNFGRRFFKLISRPIIPQHTIYTFYLYSESYMICVI